MDERLRDAIIAISLSNLAVLGKWQEVFPHQPSYFRPADAQDAYVAVVLMVLILAVVVWGVMRGLRDLAPSWLRAASKIALLGIVLFMLRRVFVQFAENGDPASAPRWLLMVDLGILTLGTLVLVAAAASRAWRDRAFRVIVVLAIILSPVFVVTAAQATAPIVDENETFQHADNPPLAPLLIENAAQPRVVWIIFDELDENLTLDNRPASVSLPAFDALRNESFVATRAFSPSDYTVDSIPAMTTGTLVEASDPTSASSLKLQLANGETTAWTSLPTVFSEARALGVNTGIVGWYHPYCRLFHQDVTRCHWEGAGRQRGATLTEDMYYDASQLVPSPNALRAGGLSPTLWRPHDAQTDAIEANMRLRRFAQYSVTDSTLRFVYLHFNTPHPVTDGMGFYDRTAGDYSTASTSNYLDNLVLADKILGELRHKMEAADTWNDTMVIVTGDHGYRKPLWHAGAEPATDSDALLRPLDRRVALLVKLPGQDHETVYEKAFNTVLLHDLVLSRLRGSVTTPTDLALWLDSRATYGASPYYHLVDDG